MKTQINSAPADLQSATSIEHRDNLGSSFWRGELKPTPVERVVISQDIKGADAIVSPDVDLVVVRNFWNIDIDTTALAFLRRNPFIDWQGTDLSILRAHVAAKLEGIGDTTLRDSFADGVARFGAVLGNLLGSSENIGIVTEFQENPVEDSEAIAPHIDPHALNATCAPLNVGTVFPVVSSSGEAYLLQAQQGDLAIFKGNIRHPRTKDLLNPGQGVVHFAPPVEEHRWVIIGTSSLGDVPQGMADAFRMTGS